MTEIPQQRMVQVSQPTTEEINLALTMLCTWINELGGFGGGAPIANLLANRLVKSDATQAIASVEDLTDFVQGTPKQVTATNEGDGTVNFSAPQDLDADATPSFVNVKLDALSPARLTSTAADGAFASVRDLMEWAFGYAHRILLDNSANDGTIIIKTPQDIDLDSSPTFRSLKILDSGGTLLHGMGDV